MLKWISFDLPLVLGLLAVSGLGLVVLYSAGQRNLDLETDQAVANDSESVIDMLEILSADVELCEKIFTDASEYLEERTISMACIPAWQCPECGDTHVDGDRRHPYLIPVNASVLFFDLKDRRLSRV
jgi:hypothetical protein